MSHSRQMLQGKLSQSTINNIIAHQGGSVAQSDQTRWAQAPGSGHEAAAAGSMQQRQALLRHHFNSGVKAQRKQYEVNELEHSEMHKQYKSPLLGKTKSMAAVSDSNALVASATGPYAIPGDNNRIIGARGNGRRKHASPNQRYQQVPTESETLELAAEHSAKSSAAQARVHPAAQMSLEDSRLAAGSTYDARDLVPVRLGSGNDGASGQKRGKYSTGHVVSRDGRKATQGKGASRARSGMKAINVQLAEKIKAMEAASAEAGSARTAEPAGQWAFSVFVRIRPHPSAGLRQQSLVQMNVRGQADQILQVIEPYDRQAMHASPATPGPDKEGQHSFLFEHVFGEAKNNLDIFQAMLQPLIPQLLDGYNVTCFAYGQTGSGKTHTMLGQFPKNKAGPSQGSSPGPETDQDKFERLKNLGISNLAIQNLFYQMYERQGDASYTVRVSYLEIYNEQVHDLLADLRDYSESAKPAGRRSSAGKNSDHTGLRQKVSSLLAQDCGDHRFRTESMQSMDAAKAFSSNGSKKDAQKKSLKIVEDPQRGVIVQDVQEIPVQEASELMDLILLGNMRRFVANTGANRFSSRSHALLIFNIEGQQKLSDAQGPGHSPNQIKILRSKLQIIDLAGSERASSTQNRGQRLVEGGNINKSLMALGQCISVLAEQSKKTQMKGQSSRSRSKHHALAKPHQFAAHNQLDGNSSSLNSPRHSKKPHIPYRDSKLTRLLKDSLGGSTKTVMIACISQLASCYEETMNTIKYASQAKSILNQKKKNEIILQEYSREEEMQRLAALAEQERIEKQKMEEAVQQKIQNMKRGTGASEAAQAIDMEGQGLDVPRKVKRDIEKIKVINLSKLESKLTMQKPPLGGAKAQLVTLLSQQFIPNIVRQYNLRHQIQSNQILIDFQTQNESPDSQSDQSNAIKQIKGLQRNLKQAQDTQAKIQNEILNIFDQVESSATPTKPSQDDEYAEGMRQTIESQQAEIVSLREQLAALQKSPAKRKNGEESGKYPSSSDKSESHQLRQELKNLELIINDKNTEIEILKQSEAKKQNQIRNELDTAMEENDQLKQLVRNLERQVETQAQKLHRKDVLIEGLKQKRGKVGGESQQFLDLEHEKRAQYQRTAPNGQISHANGQLSKFTSKDKGPTNSQQQHKQSMVELSQGIRIDQFSEGKQASRTADQSMVQDPPSVGAQTKSHLAKKQRTLKRYLSGVRVESCEAVMNGALVRQMDKSSTLKREMARSRGTSKAPEPERPLEAKADRSLDLKSKETLPRAEQRQETAMAPDAYQPVIELVDGHDLGPSGLSNKLHQRAREPEIWEEPKPFPAQESQNTERQRELIYPKLRQSVNNSRFQRNLRPRSHSRLSRSRGAPNKGSRSRSNLSRNDRGFMRSNTNVAISHDSLPGSFRISRGLGQQQLTQIGSVLIPNATEISVRRPGQHSQERHFLPRAKGLEDSFTFQNDITERPSEQVFASNQLRPSPQRQNPFALQMQSSSDPATEQPAQRVQPRNDVIGMPGPKDPLGCPRLLLNTLDPRGAGASAYNGELLAQEDQQRQRHEKSPSGWGCDQKADGISSLEAGKQRKHFAPAAFDPQGRQVHRATVGSGAIPGQHNQQQLSERIFTDNLANPSCGPGILNVSTISMEFATLNTMRSGQQESKQAIHGQMIGGGITITSIEDQILDDEYQQEQLRQMGLYAENHSQSASIFGTLDASKTIGAAQRLRGEGYQVGQQTGPAKFDNREADNSESQSALAHSKDGRLMGISHISSVQQLAHLPTLPEQLAATGLSATPQHDPSDAYQSKHSLPLQGSSTALNLQNLRGAEQSQEPSSKIITPEPKHQQTIFKSSMEDDEQQVPGSARAKAQGYIAASGYLNSEKRHSHTQAKLDQHHIQRVPDKHRDHSADLDSILSLANLYNASASGTKTTLNKNVFGQKFKEMLSLAEVRKVSKERRFTQNLVKGLPSNSVNEKDGHMVSQREISKQILIVDAMDQEKSKRGPHTDNRCSPAAELSDSEESLEGSPSDKNFFKLANHNDVYKVKSRRPAHPVARDESSQRLQQFVDDNNKKLEEILKMAEKIEMRSIENEDQNGSPGRRRSRSLRKQSQNRTEMLKRRQDTQLSQADLTSNSGRQLNSPRQVQLALSGARSWAERGHLPASIGEDPGK